MSFNHICSGFLAVGLQSGEISSSWGKKFRVQTLQQVKTADGDTYYIVCKGLPAEAPQNLSSGLIEQMVWALVSRPQFQGIIFPLYISTFPDLPLSIQKADRKLLKKVASCGYIALLNPSLGRTIVTCCDASENFLQSRFAKKSAFLLFTRSLLEEKLHVRPGWIQRLPFSSVKHSVVGFARRWLSCEQKIWLKKQWLMLRKGVQNGSDSLNYEELPLAKRKTWDPAFIHPRFAVRIPEQDQRISILIAVHWLKLGGAEKYAVDLIQFLPKDRYRIYVTTDIPSFNSWQERIQDHVEELIHLPCFLPPEMAPYFYSYFLSTRQIRLVHIHHAPRLYESLLHIRRHHPAVKIVDTLHILELPPHSGGYPEMAAKDCEVFVDCHHVISNLLKKFLMERWLVPEYKIEVNYLNVNEVYFNPAQVPSGQIRQKCSIKDEALLVGFVGRFSRQKRPLEFVKMAARLVNLWRQENKARDLQFIMAGSGEMKKEIGKAINQQGLEGIILIHEEMADPRPLYKDCDLIVMTSDNEGLALVCYEAMAMATPVFSPDVGAQLELLTPEFLVPDDADVAENLAAAVLPYLVDGARLKQAGQQARDYILHHHRSEETFQKTLLLYDRLLGQS